MALQECKTMDVPTLASHIDAQDAFVLDLRGTSHGDMIYGSTRYDPKRLAKVDDLIVPLPKGSGTIVLVDEKGGGERLNELAMKLSVAGYGELYVLDGGFEAWKAAGGKMQERSMEQPIAGETSGQGTR